MYYSIGSITRVRTEQGQKSIILAGLESSILYKGVKMVLRIGLSVEKWVRESVGFQMQGIVPASKSAASDKTIIDQLLIIWYTFPLSCFHRSLGHFNQDYCYYYYLLDISTAYMCQLLPKVIKVWTILIESVLDSTIKYNNIHRTK